MTPFFAVLIGPLVFVPTVLIVLAALFLVPLAQRPQERRK